MFLSPTLPGFQPGIFSSSDCENRRASQRFCDGHHNYSPSVCWPSQKSAFLKRSIDSGSRSPAFGVLLALRGAGVMAVTANGPQITKAVYGGPF